MTRAQAGASSPRDLASACVPGLAEDMGKDSGAQWGKARLGSGQTFAEATGS